MDLVPQSNDQTIFTLFASSVEQPIRIRVLAGESDSTVLGEFLLELGAAASRSCGVQVVVSGGTVDVSYLDTYDQVDNALCRDEVLRSIKTQLRLSDILFWTAPDIAQGISQHIMRMTVNSTFAADMHMQAASIAQQLLLNNYTGPDTTYAPVLKLETYQKTLESAIDLAMAYEHQQERFEDRKASAEDQKASLGAILGHARDVAARQSVRCDQSGAKLRAADIDLRKEQYNFESERRLLREKQVYFELGLKEWVRHEAVKAVFQLATAILGKPASMSDASDEATY